MDTYYFSRPFFRLSTKPIVLKDSSHSEIGTMQRYFKDVIDKTLSYIVDHWGINVRVSNHEGSIQVTAHQQFTWMRHKWNVTSRTGENTVDFVVEDKTVIKTNPHFIFQAHGQSYSMKKDFADKRVRLLEQQTERQVAVIEFESYMPNKINNMIMSVTETTLSPYEIVCIYYLFDLCVQ
ncbi:hypothetical protein ACFFK0_12665 [Paenibacillus chartarius]|uniref:Tubby C-terminal domain-containing protein n=1 Tax=Paenibacillus chartarius TaxID=747481 RepID=A0ABV6DKW1_9BACL